MMKYVMLAIIAAFLAGCDEPAPSKTVVDQCLRANLFKACVATAQRGLKGVSLNEDGDGIGDSVRACERATYYQSVRLREYVKPECRAE